MNVVVYVSICVLMVYGVHAQDVCEADTLTECVLKGDPDDMCGMTKCMIDKLRGCDQETIDGVLEDGTTIEQMETGYQVMCPDEAGPSESGCNLAGVMQCIPTEDSGDTSELDPCSMSKCMIDELQGCDEATLESVMGEGTSLESMEAEYEKLCAGNAGDCDIMGVTECFTQEEGENSVEPNHCRSTQCMIDQLQGCDDEDLKPMGMDAETVKQLEDSMDAMGC